MTVTALHGRLRWMIAPVRKERGACALTLGGGRRGRRASRARRRATLWDARISVWQRRRALVPECDKRLVAGAGQAAAGLCLKAGDGARAAELLIRAGALDRAAPLVAAAAAAPLHAAFARACQGAGAA